MNSWLEELHDIDGLDPVGVWPLAPASWVLLIGGGVVLCAVAYFAWRRLAFKRSWKNDTFQKLARLEANLSGNTAKETVVCLSEYLRRIALKRFSRKECAGLMGEAWLQWLTVHDPKNFDWLTQGSLLIEVPYAPANADLPLDQIRNLIQATKEWVSDV